MKTILLNLQQTEQRSWALEFPNVPTSYAFAGVERRRTPYFVPSGQAYFWTQEWQRGEAEALRDIEIGNLTEFTSGRDAATWLLTDDE